jgi:hypothetical protein
MASAMVSASRLSFSFGPHIGDAEDVDALPSPVSQNETGTAFGPSLLTSKLDSLLSPTGRLLFEPTVTESSKAILHVMAILKACACEVCTTIMDGKPMSTRSEKPRIVSGRGCNMIRWF